MGSPMGPVSVPGWCARAGVGDTCSPSPIDAPPSEGWGLCRPLGLLHGGTPTLEASQIHQGNPERKRERAQSGTKG